MEKEKRKNKLITKNCLSSSLPTSSQKSFINSSTTNSNNSDTDKDDDDIISNLLYNNNTQIKKTLISSSKSRTILSTTTMSSSSLSSTASSPSTSITMDEILSMAKGFQNNFNKSKLKQYHHRRKLNYYNSSDTTKSGLNSEKLKLLATSSSSDDDNNDFRGNNNNCVVIKSSPLQRSWKQCKHLRFVLYIMFYVFYLITGGYIFLTIETSASPVHDDNVGNSTIITRIQSSNGTTTTTKFGEIKKLFLEKYSNVDAYELENLLNEIQKTTEIGVPTYKNLTNDIGWSFGEAFFFAGTTVTTIGYGHTPPISDLGKIFCIIYSILGIPFTLVLISAAVERLLIPSNWLLGMLNSKLGHLYQPFNIRLLHLSIIVTLVGLIFFVIPAFVLKLLEPKWSTIDSFYYVFVSLTTIGFGDFIPDGEMDEYNRTIYKVLITVYLILGIISLMLVVTIFCSIPQLNLGQLFTENGTGENEKLRLSAAGSRMYSGPSGLYIPQGDEEVRRAVVRIRPRGDDSPSPEDTTPMHARDIRVP